MLFSLILKFRRFTVCSRPCVRSRIHFHKIEEKKWPVLTIRRIISRFSIRFSRYLPQFFNLLRKKDRSHFVLVNVFIYVKQTEEGCISGVGKESPPPKKKTINTSKCIRRVVLSNIQREMFPIATLKDCTLPIVYIRSSIQCRYNSSKTIETKFKKLTVLLLEKYLDSTACNSNKTNLSIQTR